MKHPRKHRNKEKLKREKRTPGGKKGAKEPLGNGPRLGKKGVGQTDGTLGPRWRGMGKTYRRKWEEAIKKRRGPSPNGGGEILGKWPSGRNAAL